MPCVSTKWPDSHAPHSRLSALHLDRQPAQVPAQVPHARLQLGHGLCTGAGGQAEGFV